MQGYTYWMQGHTCAHYPDPGNLADFHNDFGSNSNSMISKEALTKELRDIRGELKALVLFCDWDTPAEGCSEVTMLRRRRWAYLEDRLAILKQRGKSCGKQ